MPIKRNFYNPLRKEQVAEQSENTAARVSQAQRRDGFDTVQQALESINKRRLASVEERELRYTVADGVAVFRSYWASLTRQHTGSIASPLSPTKHVPAIKRSFVHPLRDAEITVSAFLQWLFENWGLVRHNRAFQKFRHYPEHPSIGWVIKYSELYLRIFQDSRAGIAVEDEPVAAKTAEPKEDKAKIGRIVQAAQNEISKRDRELAKLRAENKRLQSKKLRRITPSTATNRKAIPDWE